MFGRRREDERMLPVSPSRFVPAGFCVAALLAAIVTMGSQWQVRASVRQAAAAEAALPRRTMWVWERREDMRDADPAGEGVAVLEETLRLGAAVQLVPRRQPIAAPAKISWTAVVRIETEPGFAAQRTSRAVRTEVVRQLKRVADAPGVAALQIDFDARRSEHGFYRSLLQDVRREMPAGMPLEMTALVSWCANDDWIHDLPVNLAVPMFFRMEPDRRRAAPAPTAYRVQEPLCMGAAGVSTGEPWPRDLAGKRVFIFAEKGWSREDVSAGAAPASKRVSSEVRQ